jgi:formate dehydrogenase maturation protein FdhE
MSVAFESWDTRKQRAEELARTSDATGELLTFYANLLESQKQVDEFLRGRRGWLPSGSVAQDLPVLRECLPLVLRTVAAHGPHALADEARKILGEFSKTADEMLLRYWHAPSDTQFFAKALAQPYLRWLGQSGGKPCGRVEENDGRRCSFCGGMPQVSFLQSREASSESGNRDLVCATCTISWPFKRVACAYCGEERPMHLCYFHTPAFDHIRVEACDTCKRYIKGVDLTRLGFAIPMVDEVAASALDVWAQEQGYRKIELNLVGL